ncbi:hypothetical protein BXU06_12010 [Aquaspirillum sp. LM1]|jgi:tetratricopeptide (TPR) repeat protein|uniref:hypothetical protein n=1 Tax=Aquaspirillum sp. LM1 TaxID=1938604 RepID=UPI000983A952|nr:hypothetical protein [Aquaspirillum sp. LM1]AQR65693.1 hypothetical protein BXU06_12010 [Aquaspirillum sp. LM1]
MDLLDFTDCSLYFETALPPEVEQLMNRAAECYGQPEAELALLRAFLLAPDNLTVLVGLYRYYFYQHRLNDALEVANRAMSLAGQRLGIAGDWQRLDEHSLAVAAAQSFGLLRFYLLAIKAASVVLLRLGHIDDARARLSKLVALDQRNQLGASDLLDVIDPVTDVSAA